MIVERNLLISILKFTKNGDVEQEMVNKAARIPTAAASKLLQNLQSTGLVYLQDNFVCVDRVGRLKIAAKAVELGADIEQLSGLLEWQEFEALTALALELNGYAVAKNLRFKHEGKRWEIDVVGCKKPYVVCIDCKQWRHGITSSVLAKVVSAQTERVSALANSLPHKSIKLECSTWNNATFFPIILSLVPSRFKLYNNVPVVPVLQLQNFLSQMLGYLDSLTFFAKEFKHL